MRMTMINLGVKCIGKDFSRSTKVFSDEIIPGTGPRPRIGIRGKVHVLISQPTHVLSVFPVMYKTRMASTLYIHPRTRSISRSNYMTTQSTCSSTKTTCTFFRLREIFKLLHLGKSSHISYPRTSGVPSQYYE